MPVWVGLRATALTGAAWPCSTASGWQAARDQTLQGTHIPSQMRYAEL